MKDLIVFLSIDSKVTFFFYFSKIKIEKILDWQETTEAYSKPCQISKIERFEKAVTIEGR